MGPIDPSQQPGIANLPPAPGDASGAGPDLGAPPAPPAQPQQDWNALPVTDAPDAAGADEQPPSFLPITSIGADSNPADSNLPDLEHNWAGDPDVDTYITVNLMPLLTDTRSNRLSLMEEWNQIRNMKLLKHDENQSYIGRSKVYVPSYAKAADTLVSNLTRGLFPSEDYLEAVALDSQNDEQAELATAYVKWELEQNAKIRLRIKPMLREYVDYDLGVSKIWFNKVGTNGKRSIQNNTSLIDKMLKAQGGQSYGPDSSGDGIKFSARSIFHWYVFPWTAANIDEALFVFEDIEVSRDYLLMLGAQQGFKHVDEVSRGGNEPANWRAAETEKLSAQQGNPTSPVDTIGSERGRQVVLTEIWASIPLPGSKLMKESQHGSAYVEGDDPSGYVPVRIVIAGQYVMSVRRNPMWCQRFPYAVAQGAVEPGAFYSRGTGHKGRALQYASNDLLNQTIDNGTYALNPGMVYNPTTINGELPKIRPGWTLASLDPSQVKFHLPPHEQLQAGERMTKWAIGMQADYTGAPPITQGDNTGGSASTATGAQILQHNANTPMQDKVEELEIQLMTPIAEMVWALGQQYRDGDFLMQVTGKKMQVNAKDLVGRYLFRWLASQQASSAHQRVNQATQLLAQLMPMAPLIQQQGYNFDPVPLIRKIYQEGLGLRNFDSFIRKLQPGEQPVGAQRGGPPGAGAGPPGGGGAQPPAPPKGGPMLPGAKPPAPANGQPGSQAPAPIANAHSANGGAPPQPGEGGPFGFVRDNADALSRGGGR